MGTFGSGVIKFNGTTWTTYDTAATKLTTDWVQVMGFSSNGTKWFQSWSFSTPGLSTLTGTTWAAVPIDANGWKGR